MEMTALDYEISKKYAIPASVGVGRRPVYPFSQMEIGDSFAVLTGELEKVRSAASNFKKRHGKTFCVQKHGDGHRCWRTA